MTNNQWMPTLQFPPNAGQGQQPIAQGPMADQGGVLAQLPQQVAVPPQAPLSVMSPSSGDRLQARIDTLNKPVEPSSAPFWNWLSDVGEGMGIAGGTPGASLGGSLAAGLNTARKGRLAREQQLIANKAAEMQNIIAEQNMLKTQSDIKDAEALRGGMGMKGVAVDPSDPKHRGHDPNVYIGIHDGRGGVTWSQRATQKGAPLPEDSPLLPDVNRDLFHVVSDGKGGATAIAKKFTPGYVTGDEAKKLYPGFDETKQTLYRETDGTTTVADLPANVVTLTPDNMATLNLSDAEINAVNDKVAAGGIAQVDTTTGKITFNGTQSVVLNEPTANARLGLEQSVDGQIMGIRSVDQLMNIAFTPDGDPVLGTAGGVANAVQDLRQTAKEFQTLIQNDTGLTSEAAAYLSKTNKSWSQERALAEYVMNTVVYANAKQQKGSSGTSSRLNAQDMEASKRSLGFDKLTSARTIMERLKLLRGDMQFKLKRSIAHLGDTPYTRDTREQFPGVFSDTPVQSDMPPAATAAPYQIGGPNGPWIQPDGKGGGVVVAPPQ